MDACFDAAHFWRDTGLLALPLGRIMMFHEQAARIVAERNRAAR